MNFKDRQPTELEWAFQLRIHGAFRLDSTDLEGRHPDWKGAWEGAHLALKHELLLEGHFREGLDPLTVLAKMWENHLTVSTLEGEERQGWHQALVELDALFRSYRDRSN